MLKLPDKRSPVEHADANACQYAGQDRFGAVGGKIAADWHAESAFRSGERSLRHVAVDQAIVIDEFSGRLHLLGDRYR